MQIGVWHSLQFISFKLCDLDSIHIQHESFPNKFLSIAIK
jgi:hypothetical protein